MAWEAGSNFMAPLASGPGSSYTQNRGEQMTAALAQARPKAPNKDQSLLKLVAIITMMVDHVGVIFFPGVLWFRIIGRIAFPLFCWGLVVGVERSSNRRLYGLRLLLLAFVSQPFYMLALNHTWTQFNVIATLLLGFLAIVGIREKWHFSQYWAPALCLLVAAGFQMDYGWRGVLLIILMHLVKDSRAGLGALMTAFCLYWGGGGTVVPQSWVHAFTTTPVYPLNLALREILGLFKVQSLAILALPLMLIPTRSGLRLPKWFSYAAYPVHLCVLWLLSLL